MQFNVAQLMKERTGATRNYAVRENIENLDPDLVVLDELAGDIQLLRTIDGVLATGELTTTAGLVCDRCLTPFAQPLRIDLADEFKPSLDMVSGASLPIRDDDEGNVIDAHHILDLQEVVRQRLLLEQPLHPLCRDECRGLCPHCGQNLNEGRCACDEPTTDPRWAALRELLSSR
ncbi:MAG: DUF177 domain-containing protein [Chloroflexota bacterium]